VASDPAPKAVLAKATMPSPVSPTAPTATAPQRPATPPAAASTEINYVSYTARLLTVSGKYMRMYATTLGLSNDGSLITHGISVGRQGEMFRNSLYFGYGTEWGGGNDTLKRYELSWQFLYTPLGASCPLLKPC
jgi:hypothetical protein